jgi:isopenicillin N synthase-like dioxygenase
MPDADAIPVIDLGPYLAGASGALDRVAAELRHALTDIGFYSIVNHGVPSALVDEVYRQVARFHARPLDEKLKIGRCSGNIARATLNGSIGPWRAVRRHDHVRQFMEGVTAAAQERAANFVSKRGNPSP